MYTGEFPLSSILTFPLGVLEIKLHDEPPAWVTDLVSSGYLVRPPPVLTSLFRVRTFQSEDLCPVLFWIPVFLVF